MEGRGHGGIPDLDLRRRAEARRGRPGAVGPADAGPQQVRREQRASCPGRERAAADDDRHHDPRRCRDRWPLRRDQGSPRWLLPGGGQGPRRGDRDRQAGAGATRRSRSSPRHGLRLTTTAPAAVAAAVADAHRRDWAFVLAATVRVTRDLDLAEECVQDAYARALTSWTTDGVPARPGGWLTTVARRRALDLLRRESVLRRALPLLVEDAVEPAPEPGDDGDIPDDRLRLICTCCHPSIAPEAQVALTLRLLCGLTTAEVARAFLVT